MDLQNKKNKNYKYLVDNRTKDVVLYYGAKNGFLLALYRGLKININLYKQSVLLSNLFQNIPYRSGLGRILVNKKLVLLGIIEYIIRETSYDTR